MTNPQYKFEAYLVDLDLLAGEDLDRLRVVLRGATSDAVGRSRAPAQFGRQDFSRLQSLRDATGSAPMVGWAARFSSCADGHRPSNRKTGDRQYRAAPA
jgi:hypothetical protein